MSMIRLDPRLAQRLSEKKALLDQRRPLSPTVLRRLYDELRITLTYHSNAIEGNTLSLRETQLVIEHGVTIGEKSMREHLEARNHAEAFDHLVAIAQPGTDIDEATILTMHRLVMDKNLASAGSFRAGPVRIIGSSLQPPPARDVRRLMAEWAAWPSGEGQGHPPVVRAVIAHHGFLAVHPFEDGNGRTGRLLLNLMLMRAGYPPALLLREWRVGYIEALAQADRGRSGPLLNLIGRAIEQGLDLYLEACQIDANDEWLPLADLATESGHSAEYLALLIRKGRLAGTKRGRQWYTTRAALDRYQQEVAEGCFPPGRPRSRRP
ncbi:MAG: hypothetical protein RLZZ387_1252 [Chloroflexota bacterium]|jgi:Fic family protein